MTTLKDRNVAAYSSTDSQHSTYCADFALTFWGGIITEENDINNDGIVTLQESYERAKTQQIISTTALRIERVVNLLWGEFSPEKKEEMSKSLEKFGGDCQSTTVGNPITNLY